MSTGNVSRLRLWGAAFVAASSIAFSASCEHEKTTYPLLPDGGGGQGGTSTAPAASCADGLKNQGESDVDCGGPCAKCADGAACREDADCENDPGLFTSFPAPSRRLIASTA